MPRWPWFAIGGVAAIILIVTIVVLAADDDEDDESPPATSEATETTSEGDGSGSADGGDEGGDVAETVTVSVSDNAFSPQELEISVGTTVTWEWDGSNQHSVVGTSEDPLGLDSGVQSEGSFEVTFDEPGSYEYQCGVHGTAMSGKVVVS